MRTFKDEDEARKAKEEGEIEDVFIAHGPDQETRDAILLAAQFGNRTQRRGRSFGSDPRANTQISPAERNRRRAARRVGKAQRKRNGGR